MQLRILCAATMLWLAGAVPAHGQFWEKKDWKTWSKSECEKMLTDSPWAKRFQTSVYREGPTGMASGTGGFHGENRVELEYTVELRSARPIRQAVVRLAMLQNKYDQMNDDDRKAFDDRSKEYLDQSFENRVVAHVQYKTNLQEIDRFLAEVWQRSPERAIPIFGDLIGPKGERIRPVRFLSDVGGPREFELIFPKAVEEQSFVREGDKEIGLELPDIPVVILRRVEGPRQDLQASGRGTQTTEGRLLVRFDLRKMQFQGKLEY